MWTKLSDDFPDDLFRETLSDAAFRTHVEGLCWSGRHLLDGRLAKRTLGRFAFTDNPETAAAELVAAGYWRDDGDAWVIVHHLGHQQERAVVEHRRALTAERARRHRLHKAGDHSSCDQSSCNALRNALHDALPGTGRDGTGRDRREERSDKGKGQGQARTRSREESVPLCEYCQATTAMVTSGQVRHHEGRPWCGWCTPEPAGAGATA